MRTRALLVALLLATVPALAGCLGAEDDGGDTGGDGGGGEPRAPVAQFAITPATGGADDTFTFDASASTDADGDALTYAWEIGVFAKKTGQKVTHRFGFTDATVPVKLTVTDATGLSATASKDLKLGTGRNNAPTVSVVAPAWVKPGEAVAFEASAADPDGDAVTLAAGWAASDAAPAVDSGDIPANGRWTHTFQEEGTFLLHCHPHPFMKHNVTVLAGAQAPAGGRLDVQIVGFKYVPENVVVPPGTVVAYLNKDQVVHTVTLERFSPELEDVGLADGKGSVTFDADGRYEIMVTATDAKGAVGTGTAVVLVDSNKPDERWTREWSGRINATVAGTALEQPGRHSFKVDFPAKGNLTLTFTSAVPNTEMTLALQSSDGGSTSLTASGASPVVLAVDVPAGTYTAVVTAERAASVDYTLAADLVLALTPPAEEDHGGDGHAHQH